jgi:hydrogenase maturation factor
MHPDATVAAPCDPDHGCITCGDEAQTLRVLRVDDERGLALCEDGQGRRSSVETALVAPVAPGDALLVHAGTAIAWAGAGEAGCGGERSETG